MSIWEMFYQLIVEPLKIIMEVIYGVAYNVTGNAGAAIIPLSLVVNFILLPFYIRADVIQQEERTLQRDMEAVLGHIKHTFRSDERYMMQQAYYRIQRYKPVHALKTAIPLLIQIPVFIAAYHFLSNLTLFKGMPFFVILDLSKPDGLLPLGDRTVNLLPVLMTLINILSSEIYAEGIHVKDRIRLHIMALVFLVLLYRSPSGLVIYWTLNNLFSLAKNLVAKMHFTRNQKAMGAPDNTGDSVLSPRKPWLFLSGCFFMSVLSGAVIPSSAVSDSPAEFLLVSDYRSPQLYVLQAFLLSTGVFVVWLGVFYYLAKEKTRNILEIVIWIVCICGLVNYMLFGTGLGLLNSQLQYENAPSFSTKEIIINSAVQITAVTGLIILWKKRRRIIKNAVPVILIAAVFLSVKNTMDIQEQLPDIKASLKAGATSDNTIRLSRNGKNVVVIMMDAAISGFVPYCFREKPELEQQYDGFTWYPNTISYGSATNTGSPGLYGGYEYIPEEMNRRSDIKLSEKQNEALRLMPVLFSHDGYRVTVCNPTYANYSWIPDVSIYDDYPEIKAFNLGTEQGSIIGTIDSDAQFKIWKRNFFCYSIMKLSPLAVQPFLYQDGSYFSPDRYSEYLHRIQMPEGFSKATGVNENFVKAYNALSSLPDITEVFDEERNSFFMMSNDTAHDRTLLQEPDYAPSMHVDNTEYDNANKDRFSYAGRVMRVRDTNQIQAYQINMAALLKMGEWFDYLRSEGIYDNTRIIIVADHGSTLRCFDDMIYGDQTYEDVMRYNPLLMVKDFDCHEFNKDERFMTNADTPFLAFEGLIDNPVNPATGKSVSDELKYADEQHLFFTEEFQVNSNNGNTYNPGVWISLKNQNIFDHNNWKVIGTE